MSTLPSPINAVIEQGIDALLRLDPETRDRLESLDGRVIAVNVTRPDVQVTLSIVGKRVNVIGSVDTPADTTLSGSLSAFKSLSSGNDALYKGEVSVQGDLQVGQQLQDIIARLDPDWEELLSPVMGDTVVHQFAVASQSLSSWFDRARTSFNQNTSEYLQEEAELLAPNSEISTYCLAVDDVRASADRLEARIQRLERQMSNTSGDNAC